MQLNWQELQRQRFTQTDSLSTFWSGLRQNDEAFRTAVTLSSDCVQRTNFGFVVDELVVLEEVLKNGGVAVRRTWGGTNVVPFQHRQPQFFWTVDFLGSSEHCATSVVQVGDDFVWSLVDPTSGSASLCSCRNWVVRDEGVAEQADERTSGIAVPDCIVDVFFVTTASSQCATCFERHAAHVGSSNFVDVEVVSATYGLDVDRVLTTADFRLWQVDSTGVDNLRLTDAIVAAVGQGSCTSTAEGQSREALASFEVWVQDVVGSLLDDFQLTLEEQAIGVRQTDIGIHYFAEVVVQGCDGTVLQFYFTHWYFSLKIE